MLQIDYVKNIFMRVALVANVIVMPFNGNTLKKSVISPVEKTFLETIETVNQIEKSEKHDR